MLPQGTTTDQRGNLYTVGTFFQSTPIDFDPGPGGTPIATAGNTDGFVQRLDADGNLDWVYTFGGTFNDGVSAVTADGYGNIYVCGFFTGTIDVDPGPGVTSLTSAPGPFINGFVLKLDTAGQFVWAKNTGSAITAIDIDPSGNILLAGEFANGAIDFDPGPAVATLTTNGGLDIFYQKLDPQGNLIWVKSIGGTTNSDRALGLVSDDAGNIYSTGSFRDTVDFDPGVGTSSLFGEGTSDGYLLKLDSSGNFQWANRFGGSGADVSTSIDLDAAGNPYVTGRFMNTVDFDPGSGVANRTAPGFNDVFVLKTDTAGNYQWVNTLRGTNYAQGTRLLFDVDDNLFVLSRFADTVDIDPGAGVTMQVAQGDQDFLLQQLDVNGNVLTTLPFGGIQTDDALLLSADSAGYLYMVGHFQSTVDFDPGPGVANLTTAANDNVFFLKLFHCVTQYGNLQASACGSYTSPSGNFTWSASGTYTDMLMNGNGCDSVVAVHLTILNSDTTLVAIACDTYTAPSGQVFTSSGTYQDIIPNVAGCDSVIAIQLTVSGSTNASLNAVACDAYTTPGGTVLTASG
ncbi:MAG: hypothetical protein AAGB22_09705, partial [Bacteroidota bacterium]